MTHYAIAHHADQPWRAPWINVRWVFSGTGAENSAHAMCEASSEACLLIKTDQPITTGRLQKGITGQRTYYEGATEICVYRYGDDQHPADDPAMLEVL